MPTGRVVGVLQRNWRDYVASFAENEVLSLYKCFFTALRVQRYSIWTQDTASCCLSVRDINGYHGRVQYLGHANITTCIAITTCKLISAEDSCRPWIALDPIFDYLKWSNKRLGLLLSFLVLSGAFIKYGVFTSFYPTRTGKKNFYFTHVSMLYKSFYCPNQPLF